MSDVTRKFLAALILFMVCAGASAANHTILVFGDSISAAQGMDEDQGWVHLLSLRLKKENPAYRVVNASMSGETTGGGVVRLPKTLELHQPDIVILELGGNDGLRGYPVDMIEANLEDMTRMALNARAHVLIMGIVLPPNYGARYIDPFKAIFPQVADKFHVPLLPYPLQGIDTSRNLIQQDGIHPTAKAQPMIMEQVWQKLVPLLQASKQVELQPGVAPGQ
ncbi:MAG TPA: arylesterase [Pseudomonadales bacterium]|nr:arylesterase [Pseudomonadales bacterium]